MGTPPVAIGAVTTVAGTGTAGYNGDSWPSGSAHLYNPYGVAVDGAGNLYIADTANHRVRMVSPAGLITTVAGTGTAGLNGDGGPAAAGTVDLYYPSGVAVDGAGNLCIADRSNQRVRMVSPAGLVTTVAGTGTAGYNGDGGPAGSAQLNAPSGVAVDGAGNLYIADRSNQRVRMVDLTATPPVITTVAGTGTAGYNGDGGPAGSAQLNAPTGVAVDGEGNLYIADRSNQRVRQVELAPRVSS
jgi:sugar lactone lactonase YvrE